MNIQRISYIQIWTIICVFLSGILIGIFFSIIFFKGTSIINNNSISTGSQVVLVFLAFIGLGQLVISYYIQVESILAKAIANFRKEIILLHRETLDKLDDSNKKLEKININEKTIFSKKEFAGMAKTDRDKLNNFFNEYINPKNAESSDNKTYKNIYIDILLLLNAIEELSISIIGGYIKDNDVLKVIQKPFVQIIETYSIPLYIHVVVFEDKYPYTIHLYKYWKTEVGDLDLTTKRNLEEIIDLQKDIIK